MRMSAKQKQSEELEIAFQVVMDVHKPLVQQQEAHVGCRARSRGNLRSRMIHKKKSEHVVFFTIPVDQSRRSCKSTTLCIGYLGRGAESASWDEELRSLTEAVRKTIAISGEAEHRPCP